MGTLDGIEVEWLLDSTRGPSQASQPNTFRKMLACILHEQAINALGVTARLEC